jgi:hypothetical protein
MPPSPGDAQHEEANADDQAYDDICPQRLGNYVAEGEDECQDGKQSPEDTQGERGTNGRRIALPVPPRLVITIHAVP